MLNKAAVPVPSPSQEETVSVPELGGDVLVRGLLLKDRLELAILEGYGRMSGMLAAGVFVADKQHPRGEMSEMVPLFTAEEWERWGSKHYSAAINLWDVVRRLSDFSGEEAAKNSSAQSSDLPSA